MTDAGERLRRLLGGEATTWLLRRARDRLERGRPLTGTVMLGEASPDERRALERLLGRRAGTGTSVSVSLEEVDRILRDSGASPGGLSAAVIELTGPLCDLSAEQAGRTAAWRDAYTAVDVLLVERPELAGWRGWLDRTGIVRRLATGPESARGILDPLAAVIHRLPSSGIPIGRLAAESCGDAHALDEGRPVGTLALSAARALAGLPYPADGTADSRRSAWAAVGVHLDELSSLVLCLGLPGNDRSGLGRVLAAGREIGEPCVLTLRQLRRHEEPIAAGPVRICENPVVVAAAADELGPRSPALVCVGGRPSTAAWRLLDLLAAGGAEFAYHGDFDWGGVAIANAVHERFGWRPWCYTSSAYEAAAPLTDARLTGRTLPTPWDPALSSVMERHGVRVEEELVLDTLLADLAGQRGM